MTIGFDASRAFTKNRTGTENYSYQLLTHLAKIDTENHYLVYIRPGQEMPKGVWPPNFKFQILNFKFLWTQAGLAAQTFKDKLDVLFVPAHTLPLIRRPGLKTVVTVHDLGAEYLPSAHQLKQRLYLNLTTHHQLKSATHLIAVSEATKTDLVKKIDIPKDKISVIYEGYDKNKFKIQTASWRSKFKVNQSIKQYNLSYQNYFLFVGTIQPRKNLIRLITAYAQSLKSFPSSSKTSQVSGMKYMVCRDKDKQNSPLNTKYKILNTLPQLVLAGSKGWLSDEIYALPKKLGIEKHVKFLGYVPDEDLPALYCGATAFLYPSLFEGFGLPILEAIACGCPVLASNTSSIPEVAGKAALLVDPYSIEEISAGISSLTTNHELRTTLTKLGQAQVKKFSWEKCARETLRILEQVAGY